MMRRERDSGAIAIFVAVASILFLMIAALVVDLGMAMQKRSDAQKAVDLAALAGGQDLPDKNAAMASVADYLISNGWGTDLSGAPVSQATLINNLTTPSLEDGYVEFFESSLGATRMQVTAPERSVPFVFAPVGDLLGGGKSGTRVSASATVEIRSVDLVLPFQVPGGATPGIQCVKNNTADPCSDQTEGDFGLLDFPRNDVSGLDATIEKNIREGVQFTPALIPNAEAVLAQALAASPPEIKCTASPAYPLGAIPIDSANLKDGFNCVGPGPGNKASVVGDALIGKGGCNGRLAVPAASPGAIQVAGCPVSPDKFATYTNPASDYSNYNSWKPIDPSIINDPRFGILPVVASKNLVQISGPAKQVPIVRFYGSYYRTFFDSTGVAMPPSKKTNVSAVSAYIFPLDLIDGVSPNDVATIPYIGGAKIPVLVD